MLALERDGAGAALRRYVYGEHRISMTTGANVSYYHHDKLGSVANVTSASGTGQWTYDYEPFGATRLETEDDPASPQNVLKFAGELLDPTGLYYLRARLYDPSSGRFTRRDPASPDPGEPYISSYAYAANRPTSMIDPSGMTFIPSNEGQDAAQKPASPGSTERQLQLHRPGDRNTVVYPIPAGYPKKIAPPGVHATDGLKGYPAMDLMAPAGTPVLAVVDGKIRRWSGSDPANGPVGNIHGPFGFSIYLAGSSGSDFYYTHLGTRRRAPGQPVRAGDIVGTIGNYARWGGANHAHIGVHGGPITIGMVYRSPQVGGR